MWERITYFLDACAVAAENKGAHRVPSARSRNAARSWFFAAVHRVLGSVDGLKRFIDDRRESVHG